MSKISVAAGLAACLAAGAIGLIASAPARAESVMKECGAEWKAAKANNTTNGQTWQQFLPDCKKRHEAGGTQAATTPAAAPAPAPSPTMAPEPKPTRQAKVAPAAPSGAGQFQNEAEAKGHCPTDTVVWVNTKSHKYHYAGHRSYGTTKQGAYMCEGDAKAAGEAAAKGEKPKG